jgi:sporulation integral membrane protein YtvI
VKKLQALPRPLLNTLKLLAVIAGTLIGLYLAVIFVSYAAPFVIAFALAMAINPLVNWLAKKRKFTISRSAAALITTTVALLVIFWVLLLLGSLLVKQATDMLKLLPYHFPSLQRNLLAFVAELGESMDILPDYVLQAIQNFIVNLGTTISAYTAGAAIFVFDTARFLPFLFLFVLLTVLATYFFAKDYPKLRAFVINNLPPSWLKQYRIIKADLLAALIGYFKATLIFIFVTFVLLLAGLLMLKVKYDFILSVIISLFDALPAIGAGLFFIPWSLYLLIIGEKTLAIGLFILYVVVLGVRQVISPKILGDQFGLHPLSTMIAMFLGLRLLGVVGLVTGPVIFLIIKHVVGYYTRGRSFKEVIFG